MKYLHENRLVHGDLKPQNVLLLPSAAPGSVPEASQALLGFSPFSCGVPLWRSCGVPRAPRAHKSLGQCTALHTFRLIQGLSRGPGMCASRGLATYVVDGHLW
jgi:hypothetical protein